MTNNADLAKKISAFSESNYISACKTMAILSVICAHCCYIIPAFGISNRIMTNIMLVLAKFGVAVFFVISGYLFEYNKRNIRDFTKRKISSLVIPWAFTGTLVYLYVNLRKGHISPVSYFIWITGANSYLWYMTVLLALYYIFLAFRKFKWFPYIAVIISAISYAAVATGILKLQNQYLNICNWMWLFAIGILINRYSALEKVCVVAKKYILLTVLMYAGMTYLFIRMDYNFSYWSIYYIPYLFISLPFIFSLAGYVQHLITIQKVGKMSFSIYLIHMPFAGLIANLFNRFDLWFTTPFRPFIVITITVSTILLYTVMMKKLKMEKVGQILIGGR
jgi:Uncharacterized protein conserved in bacteria